MKCTGEHIRVEHQLRPLTLLPVNDAIKPQNEAATSVN
jgi:hypothetical protein